MRDREGGALPPNCPIGNVSMLGRSCRGGAPYTARIALRLSGTDPSVFQHSCIAETRKSCSGYARDHRRTVPRRRCTLSLLGGCAPDRRARGKARPFVCDSSAVFVHRNVRHAAYSVRCFAEHIRRFPQGVAEAVLCTKCAQRKHMQDGIGHALTPSCDTSR